jgi:UDP-N-acetylmuramoyl-tripeptide--D-alanyl-D-alanine ligase
VLTVVQNHSDHYSGLDDIATEKRRLVESLPRDGLAVLNADVEHVRDMARQAPCRVFTFGQTPGSDLFIDNIDGAWPERLRFRATYGQETVDVRTRLVGRHQWTPAAGALAVAVNLGVNLTDAAAALSRVAPHTARLEPVRLPGGAMLCDYCSALGFKAFR